jgi:hypothetical protein
MKAETNLGPMLSVYQGRPLRWRDLFFVFIPGALAALAPLGYGIWRANYAYAHFGPSAARAWSASWLLLAGFASLALLFLGLYRLYASHRFIAIHENGLRIGFSALRAKEYSWSEISGISIASIQDRFLGFPLHTAYQTVIHPNIGRPIRLDKSFGNPERVKEEIEAQLYPRMLPELHDSLKKGKPIFFGDLAIDSRGLEIYKRQLSWNQIDHMAVDSGFLVVKSEEFGLIRVPISRIPNLDLLFHLAELH